jgi:predicted metal-binding membrane protein
MNLVPLPERILASDRRIVVTGLVTMTLLAWLYLLSGAGMNMDMSRMISLALLPQQSSMAVTSFVSWSIDYIVIVVLMWWIMMIAMMLPGAAPTVLLYARVIRQSSGSQSFKVNASVMCFITGYLLVWLVFSLLATGLQWWLEQQQWISMHLASRNVFFSAAILFVVGLYQLTPLKDACLRQCQAPAVFIVNYMKPGLFGALRMGLAHGVFCLGCCVLLMTLLFVGGVMNMLWVAVLMLFIIAEKCLVNLRYLPGITGILLILWAFMVLILSAAA